MSDIVIAGNTYTNVPQIIVPKVGGGSSLFTDVSATTAAATDVANGKIFYDASGVQTIGTASGGGGSLKQFVLRPDAELVQSWTYDKLLVTDEKVTIPAYNTTAQKVLSAASLTPNINAADDYTWIAVMRALVIPVYSSLTPAAGWPVFHVSSGIYEIVMVPANTVTVQSLSAGVFRASTVYGPSNRNFYFSSDTKLTSANNSYGAYVTFQAQDNVSGTTFTFKSPAFYMRGHNTYCKQAAWQAWTDVRYQWRIDIYKAPRSGANTDGWLLEQGVRHILNCYNSGTQKLT